MTSTMTPTKAEQRLRQLVVGWGLVLIGMTVGYIGWTLPNAWTGWTLWAVAGTLATISAAVVYLAHVTRSIALGLAAILQLASPVIVIAVGLSAYGA